MFTVVIMSTCLSKLLGKDSSDNNHGYYHSKYYHELPNDAKIRYEQKEKDHVGFDPFSKAIKFGDNPKVWLSLTYLDIVNYLVSKTSFIT